MYAVIRAGGKQYRVSPGDIVKMEKQIQLDDKGEAITAREGDTIEFNDVLAVSGQEGHLGPGQGAVVSGEVMEAGRGDKVLVFHFKRKKQYKKIFGHRQPFTAVRITEIAFDGQKFTAPELPAAKPKAKHAEHKEAAHAKAGAKKGSGKKPKAKASAHKPGKKAAAKKKK